MPNLNKFIRRIAKRKRTIPGTHKRIRGRKIQPNPSITRPRIPRFSKGRMMETALEEMNDGRKEQGTT